MQRWGVAGLVVVSMLLGGIGTAAGSEEDMQSVAAGALDGKVFVGEMGKQGKTTGDKDEFRFQSGQFHSIACDPYGFGDADYTTTAQGNSVAFEAETTSPSDGRMIWKGTTIGDAIEGTATWFKKAGSAAEEYWFRGKLKPQ